jgi:hypothetical protein
MRHNREEVIKRTIGEFELLDHLVAKLNNEEMGAVPAPAGDQRPLDREGCFGSYHPLESQRRPFRQRSVGWWKARQTI